VRVLRFGLVTCACLGLSNCAGGDRSGDASVSRPPKILCQVGPDCDAKWARANEWTAKSGLQVASKSNTQIKTKIPPGYEHRMLVVTITKNATPKPGTYEISFVAGCASEFSCEPPIAESRTGFTAFVLNP
jgi:hypothetical protein